MTNLRFTFDGTTLSAPSDVSVAAALTQNGKRIFRHTDTNAPRGIFCGMGVCQDCLITVDGQHNQRACMTPLRDGMKISAQIARPTLTAPPTTHKAAERLTPSVLIVGGGAGGLNAAISAAAAGADVVLLDERKVPGGQYFKQRADVAQPAMDTQQSDGKALVQMARDASVRIIPQIEVWGAFDGPEVMATGPDCVYAIRPKSLIVATGAYERPGMIPGWTLPGVMTVGAAQTLWRSYTTLPGKRIALFGNGPLTAQVALELAGGGAEIAVLGEAAQHPLRQPLAALDMLRRDPALTAKGISMLAKLRQKRATPIYNCRPTRIAQDGTALRVEYVSNGTTHHTKADVVCLNFGFEPQNEILRLLGARMQFDTRFAQLRPDRSDTMETSVPRVFAIGDCCGTGGAPAAAVEGRIAGVAAANGVADQTANNAELARHYAFQKALWRLYDAPPVLLEDMADETLICRCEEITKGSLDTAMGAGHTDIGAVKRATRIGMGRCQGRYCAPVLAGYMARRTNAKVQDLSFFAPRIPIKPTDIGSIVAAETLLDDRISDD